VPKVGMPEIRKPQLIKATMEAINDVGLHKASVATIASYAGVSPAIINHYFGGKDGLLEATMRSVLQELADAITTRLKQVDKDDVISRIHAIVDGNFDSSQVDNKVVKTWLTFWSYSMHKPILYRLQTVNNKRLLSYLRFELKKIVPHDEAAFIAQGIASLIDGIWLRGALTQDGIDKYLAEALIFDFLRAKLPAEVWQSSSYMPRNWKA